MTSAQTPATYAQHFAIMKMVRPNLKTVGVLGSKLTEKNMQDITRAALSQGIVVFIGRPATIRDLGSIYRKMVADRKISLLWLPDPEDILLTEEGFEFIRTRALHDDLGLCVPTLSLVNAGGLMSVQREGNTVTVHINHRIAELIGTATPSTSSDAIAFDSH